MADFQQMRELHRKESAIAITAVAVVFLVYLFPAHWEGLIQILIKSPKDFQDQLSGSYGIYLGGILIPVLLYFLSVVTVAKKDIYYALDNLFFKRRVSIDKHICLALLNFKIALDADDQLRLGALRTRVVNTGCSKTLMKLFYEYIEKPDITNPALKNQAFIYWGDYFSNITFAVFGIATLLFIGIIQLIDRTFGFVRLIALLVLILIIGVNLWSALKGKIASKLIGIPSDQISQIHRKADMELLQDLRSEEFGENDETHS